MSGADAFGRLLPSIIVLAGALIALRWYLRRQGGGGGQQLVKVLSRTGLSRGALLAVVQAGDRRLLLGVTDHQINLLTELPQDAALDADGPGAAAASPSDAMDAFDAASETEAPAGPRTGFVDRLRDATVRSAPPRPPRARD